MNKNCLLFTLCLLTSLLVSAAPRYWVGPSNGNWNNPANWSATRGGPGNAGVPQAQDAVTFLEEALVNIDVSPTITSLMIGDFDASVLGEFGSKPVRFYASTPITFTIRNFLQILYNTTLKDSTSADVPFNFVFNGATAAHAEVYGKWVFEGGTPVSPGNGPTLTAQQGSRVEVSSLLAASARGGGRIILKNNTSDITSNPSSLRFTIDSYFQLDNNPGGAIPDAYWDGDITSPRPTSLGMFQFPAATILISGNTNGVLRHLASKIAYGRVVVDLTALAADASLALPSGSRISSNLEILNTNNHTLTLLAPTDSSGNVQVGVGTTHNGTGFGGYLVISGNNTKVALARATNAAPSTSYLLELTKGFTQSGGNFSLQDADEATGSSILGIRYDLIQTGGTFFTNSTATGSGTKFMVIMNDPALSLGYPEVLRTSKIISMSSGTIDNGRGMVTLGVNHSVYFFPAIPDETNGVTLARPLTVGKLALLRGPLNTTATNILTITDPNTATAVQTGTSNTSYVNGPLRRRTNSTDAYVFPTGKGNTSPASFVFDSCVVIPASAEPSLYQAEYFKTGYVDTVNVKPPLTGISKAEYWEIEKLSGADAKVKLIVNGKVPGTTNNDILTVAHHANEQWISEQGSLSIPGDTALGSVISKTLSNFGPFTFGYYPFKSIPPVFVNCPSNIKVNTEQNNCNALVAFKAGSADNATVVYKAGSKTITSPYVFEKGTTTVDVIASDNISTATCSFTVTVQDVQAPVIANISTKPVTLSPADNELKNVYIDYTVTDNCGPVTSTLSVTSNQPPMGNIADWEIIDGHNVRLRAEQSGEDRIYAITITNTDEAGNQIVKTATVTVPKSTAAEKINLDIKVMPNPSKTYFNIYIKSNSDKLVTLQAFDLFGRVKETQKFYPDATIRLGDNYRPGIYFVRIIQGNVDKYLPLLKLPD